MCEKTRRVCEYGFPLGRSRSGMLGVGSEDLGGQYLLEWMALHMARRAANVVGRSGGYACGPLCHFVVEQVFSGASEQAMRWCACELMAAGCCVLVHARRCSVQRVLPNRKCA